MPDMFAEPKSASERRDAAPVTQPCSKGSPKSKTQQGGANKDGKSDTTFSVAEDDWVNTIPPPGQYNATIAGATIHPKSSAIYLGLEYRIVSNGQPFILTELLVLDADPGAPIYSQSARGKGRVKSIMEVNGRSLWFPSIGEVPRALIGCRVMIAVRHKNIDGLPTPLVLAVVGPAETNIEET
jgi:hypothetical protein